jgi:biopolymer transport protein ExbB
MKLFLRISRISLLAALLMAPRLVPAQQVTVDDKQDQIAALQIELDQAKEERDKVIAKRWDNKQRDMDARDKFNQEFDDLKAKLDAKTQEADRLQAQIQNDLRDAEEAEAQAETEKTQFLSLGSTLHDKVGEIAQPLGKSFPTQIPTRIQRLNEVLKSAEIKRDAPDEVLNDLMNFEREELALTREITLEHRGFLRANKMPGEGLLLRLGFVTEAYRDDKSGQVGLLLKNAEGTSFTPFDWREDLPVSTAEKLQSAMQTLDKQSGDQTVLIPMDVLLTQNSIKSYTHESDQGFFKRLFHTVKVGGIFMWPLLIIPFIVVGLFISKLLQLVRARGSQMTCAEVVSKIERGDMAGAAALCARHPGNLALRVLGSVASLNQNVSREHADKTVSELMLHEVPRLESHLTTLSVLAAAAPLLGLLGTVSGLIAMFQIITEHGVNDPKLLAGGIGEALIATETGLLIAIPTLLGHNYLANRVDNLVADAEYYGMKALNARWPKE